MRLSVAFVATLLMISLLPPLAAADFSHLSLGPRVGWTRTGDSDESAPIYGAAARFKLLEFLAAELAIEYRKEETDAGDIETLPVQLSALLYVMPFLHGTVGVGFYNVDATLDAVGSQLGNIDDSASGAGLHLGAGLEIALSPRASLTGELRYVFLGYELDQADQAIDVDADFLEIAAGLQFYVW